MGLKPIVIRMSTRQQFSTGNTSRPLFPVPSAGIVGVLNMHTRLIPQFDHLAPIRTAFHSPDLSQIKANQGKNFFPALENCKLCFRPPAVAPMGFMPLEELRIYAKSLKR